MSTQNEGNKSSYEESNTVFQESLTPTSSPSRISQPTQPPTNTAQENIQLVCPKRKLTSKAWNFMKRVLIDGEEYAVCNFCQKRLQAKPNSGTRSLNYHVKTCPMRPRSEESPKKGERKGKSPCANFNFDQEVSRRELACAIILHEYPLSIVEHYGFRKFVASLQPYFKMVSRNTIKRDIMKIYDIEKEKLQKILLENRSRVAITTDMWTSNQKKGYMSITAHFIDDFWVLQSRILRFVYVPTPHTTDVLAEELLEGLISWHLETNLSTVTVDNCSTNDGMIQKLVSKLGGHCLLNGNHMHMRCCAHILNLIVKDGLQVIEKSIENIRDSVAYWSATPSRVEKFDDMVRQLRIGGGKKLCLDCKTRWNSTFLMLQIALEFKDVFPRLKLREKNYTSLPSEEDWIMASKVCEKLKVFYNATKSFSATKYPTSNSYFFMICEIKEALDKWMLESEDEIFLKMTKNMYQKFNKYWSDVHLVMAVAIILDPRYKMKAVDFFFNIFYGEYAYDEVKRVKKLCYDLLDEYKDRLTVDSSISTHTTSTSSANILGSGGFGEERSSLARLVEFLNVESAESVVKSELDDYLEEKVLPWKQEFDILGWWKTNGIKYPTLQRIARDFLAIPVSTVASESAFSIGGRVVSLHRSRLHKNTLEALMCSQSWLWGQIQDTSNGMDSFSHIEDDADEI